MSYHIQSLKLLLVLIMVTLPMGLGSNLSYFISVAVKKRGIGINLIGMVISYTLIILLVWVADYRNIFFFKNTALYMYIVAPFIGIACILVEYLIGVLVNFINTGKLVTKISIHSSYANEDKIRIFDVVMVILFVIVEEVIFRQILINMLQVNFNISQTTILLVCPIVFAINHISFGVFAIPQKIVSGLIFTLIYILAGYSILIPTIAHVTQNLLLLFASRVRVGELK